MHSKKLLRAVFVAVVAMCCMPAAVAAECLPPACAVNESTDGGVPDGVFESDGAAVKASPADPPASRGDAADDPGSAIFNPFAGAQDRQKPPFSATLLSLLNGNYAEALAIVLILALVLAGVAAFISFLRRKHS
ncbi:hypothetical protein N0K08_14040 [Acidovorax sp. Be4]|uniref:LPXTG cell wall anchor domain-containing protein n=1 Tax=Acidovorax bellezanensis TaxID=2976702 RepID=A0ABT2PMQ3_9BURK|nr:hypothetical protein [Acidovorax sp. Be4]MCT9811764.1 hypothetical protein [Acidovorax sp. Be4]